MKKLLFAALLAITSTSAAAETPLIGDPFKDVPRICLADSLDKLAKVKRGEKPESNILPFYIEVFKLDQSKQVFLTHSCDMFERGFVHGLVIAPNDLARPTIQKRRAPEATDFNLR